MKTVEQAVAAYEDGVRRFGVDNYARCADAGGWHDVAACLHEAKKRALTLENMVAKYRNSA